MRRPDLPIHHFTGQRAIGIVGGRPVWPIKGGAKDDDDRDDRDDQQDDDADDDEGDDEGDGGDDTDWEAEARKWKRLSRKHEKRAAANADKARKYDERSSRRRDDDDSTDFEAALQDARDEERVKARSEFGSRLVDAEIRAAARGRMSDDQLDAVLDGLDRGRFLEDDGEVDIEAVEDYVDRLAPAARRRDDEDDDRQQDRSGSRRRGTARGGSGMGQGRSTRRDDKSGGDVGSGRSRYQARRDARKQQTTSSS